MGVICVSINPTVGNIVGLGIVGLTSQCKITPQCHVLPTLTSQCSHARTHIHTYRHTDIQQPHNVTLYLHAKPTVLIYTFNPTMYLVQVCVCVCVCV